MIIAEIQIREPAFLAYVRKNLNRQRLPAPTIPLSEFDGRLLERIECAGCAIAPASGGIAGGILIDAMLVIHSTTAADARAAGIMEPPVTRQTPAFLQLSLTVPLNPARLQMQATQFQIEGRGFPPNLLPAPEAIPLDLPDDLGLQVAAIVVGSGAVAIRLATAATDVLSNPVINRLGTDDWARLIPGHVLAEQLLVSLREAVDRAKAGDSSIDIEHHAAGGWWPSESMAIATAELGNSNICVFGIEVSVRITVTGRQQVTGEKLVTTITIAWSTDSLLCEIVGVILYNGIYAALFTLVVGDIVSSSIFGVVRDPPGFREINRDDHSITYEMTTYLATQTPFLFKRSEVTHEGLLTAGDLFLGGYQRKLQGSSAGPRFAREINCPDRVAIVYHPPSVRLFDLGVAGGGPPNLFPNGLTIDPPGAWVAVPSMGTDRFVLALTFADPPPPPFGAQPTGRLPVGTATSALIHTDCGLRWIDLGLVPADPGPPTLADIAKMISQCKAISDRWGMGLLNLDWLIDPPARTFGIDPVREWTVAFEQLADDGRLEFVARKADGSERVLGVATGRRNDAVQVITDADETLEVRTEHRMGSPTPVVLQRWITPWASIPLEEEPISIAATRGLVGITYADGSARVVEFAGDGLHIRPLDNAASNEALLQLANKLTRHERQGRQPWASTVRIDANTVAATHRGTILVGPSGPTTKR